MKKYLVVGNPIVHSLSPRLHNNWLKENNINAKYEKTKIDIDEIESLIAERKTARANKDWAKADEVRDKLKAANIVVKDNPDGSATWTYGKN